MGKIQQEEEESESESESDNATLYHLRSRGASHAPPIIVEVKVDDCCINMEVDTGASLSLMSNATFQGLWQGRSLDTTRFRLTQDSLSLFWVVAV